MDHSLLQPLQADPHKAQAPLPVGIHLTAQAAQAHGIALQAARQHGDRHHQQQPINACRIAQAAALQLEDPRLLVAEQLLAAEALAVGPGQFQRGIKVADQVPGLINGDAAGMSQQQVGPLAAISPQLDIAKSAAVPALSSAGGGPHSPSELRSPGSRCRPAAASSSASEDGPRTSRAARHWGRLDRPAW